MTNLHCLYLNDEQVRFVVLYVAKDAHRVNNIGNQHKLRKKLQHIRMVDTWLTAIRYGYEVDGFD